VKISWKGIEVDHRTLPLTERLYRYRDTSATPYHVAVAKNAIEVTISRVPTLTVKSGIGLSAAGIVCISLRANCVNFLATLNLQVILSVTVLRRILFGFALSQVFSFQVFTSTELRVFPLQICCETNWFPGCRLLKRAVPPGFALCERSDILRGDSSGLFCGPLDCRSGRGH